MTHTDEQVAKQVQEGNTDAFAEIISRYDEKLKRYARKFLSQEHEVDELVQDVFIKTYTNIRSFDVEKRFSPWIYRIAHNTFVNELKRKSYVSFFDMDTVFPHPTAQETADAHALESEIRNELDVLIKALAPKYREVIILHYFEHLSYQEISDILEIPVTTVGVRMTRARTKLKEQYQLIHDHE